MRKLGTLLMSGLLLASMVSPAGAFLGSPGRQILEELPDPNVPLAPEVVTVNEDDGPRAYVRMTNPAPEAGNGTYVYIPEDEVPLAAADEDEAQNTADQGEVFIGDDQVPLAAADDDDSSADGFGGPGASIDLSPAADAGMSTDSTGGFPIIPVVGAVAGGGFAWWLLFGLKLFEIEQIDGTVKKVTLLGKLMYGRKKK